MYNINKMTAKIVPDHSDIKGRASMRKVARLLLLFLLFTFGAGGVFAGSGGTAKNVPVTTQGPDVWEYTTSSSTNTYNNTVTQNGGTTDSVISNTNNYNNVNPYDWAFTDCALFRANCGYLWDWLGAKGEYLGSVTSNVGSPYVSSASSSASSSSSATVTTTDQYDVAKLYKYYNSSINTLAGFEVSSRSDTEVQNEDDQNTNTETDTTNTTTVTDYYTQDQAIVNNYVCECDPIILDLDGSGKADVPISYLPHAPLFHRESAIVFDITGDGTQILTEWLGPNSGLLAVPDKNGNITSVNQLFGNSGGFNDGFEKLSLRDKNHDGKIEGDELNGLYVWRNLARDGKVHPGELVSVQSLGITSISLHRRNFKSTFVRNGKTYTAWEWWPSAMRFTPKANQPNL